MWPMRSGQADKIHLAHCHIGGTLFVRRAVLAAIGGCPEIPYAEDHELMTRIEQRYRVARCPRPTFSTTSTGPIESGSDTSRARRREASYPQKLRL